MRLFLGLPIPPELAQALTRLTRAIELPKGRPTAPENIHLTLVFLGEVAEPTLPRIEQELSELTFAPFQQKLTILNTFPRAGVLFAEVEPTRALLHLQSRVATCMARCGFAPKNPQAPEARPYTLTLPSHASTDRYGSAKANTPCRPRSSAASPSTQSISTAATRPPPAPTTRFSLRKKPGRVTQSPTPDHQRQAQRRGHSR